MLLKLQSSRGKGKLPFIMYEMERKEVLMFTSMRQQEVSISNSPPNTWHTPTAMTPSPNAWHTPTATLKWSSISTAILALALTLMLKVFSTIMADVYIYLYFLSDIFNKTLPDKDIWQVRSGLKFPKSEPEEVRHESQNEPILPSCQYKKGHAESAFCEHVIPPLTTSKLNWLLGCALL